MSDNQSTELKRYIKYVNFDLSTKELKKHFDDRVVSLRAVATQRVAIQIRVAKAPTNHA